METVNVENTTADIDALLAEISGEPKVEEPTVEAEAVDASVEKLEAIEREIDHDALKAEVYAAQPAGNSEIDPDAVTDAASTTGSVSGEPATGTTTRAAVSRTRGDIGALPAESFVLTSDVPADLEANKAAVIASKPTAKKIAEKFDNLLLAVSAGKLPSAYTMVGFKALQAGEITGPKLVEAMQAAGYTIGTARSQSQQVINLFQTLKLAVKADGKFKLNPESTLAAVLAGLAAPAPEPTSAAA